MPFLIIQILHIVAAKYLSNISLQNSLDTKTNPTETWKIWKQMCMNYSNTTKLGEQNIKYQTVLFFQVMRPDALTIDNGFLFTRTEENTTWTQF